MRRVFGVKKDKVPPPTVEEATERVITMDGLRSAPFS